MAGEMTPPAVSTCPCNHRPHDCHAVALRARVAEVERDNETLQGLYDGARDTENAAFGIPGRPPGSAANAVRWQTAKLAAAERLAKTSLALAKYMGRDANPSETWAEFWRATEEYPIRALPAPGEETR